MFTRLQIFKRAANNFLFLDGLNYKVGLYWTCQFFDYYLKYFKCKQKPTVVKQKNTHNFKNMEEYFETFCKLVK